MNLSKIYASKIYLTSSRQNRIHAAIEDPMNVELVQQVAEYLDDDSKQKLKKAVSEKNAKKSAEDAAKPSEDSDKNVFDEFESHSAPASSGGHASIPHSSGSGNVFDDFDASEPEGNIPEGDENTDIPEPPTDDAPEDSEPVEEATEITGVDEIDTEDSAVLQSGIVKKLLNDEDDAAGVVRVDIGDDEAWIYYDDKVNLNDVLDNVISIIKSNGYDMLKFSRLARTDNAVVFDIKE